MKAVMATLVDGYPVTITEQWFIDVVERGAEWMMAAPVVAKGIGGIPIKVNPKYIAYLYLVEDGEVLPLRQWTEPPKSASA